MLTVQELNIKQITPTIFEWEGEYFRGDASNLVEVYNTCNPSKKFRIWLIDLGLKVYADQIKDFIEKGVADAPMSPTQFVEQHLHSCEYGEELTKEQEEIAAKNGLVVCFGASDDLLEFRGAFDDETSAWRGAVAYFNKVGNTIEYSEITTQNWVKAIWAPRRNDKVYASWSIFTMINNAAPFNVHENGELYCIGTVFSIYDMQ